MLAVSSTILLYNLILNLETIQYHHLILSQETIQLNILLIILTIKIELNHWIIQIKYKKIKNQKFKHYLDEIVTTVIQVGMIVTDFQKPKGSSPGLNLSSDQKGRIEFRQEETSLAW
jgi:hypothetical protein